MHFDIVYIFVIILFHSFRNAAISLSFQIDFVAHDDLPYAGEGHEDVYKDIKEKGM